MGEAVTDPTRKGWLTSILELGAWFGALYAGFLADVMSRKYAIIFNTCIFIIGVVVQCTAVSGGAPAILGGHFIVGMKVHSQGQQLY
jgi:MFS family permease